MAKTNDNVPSSIIIGSNKYVWRIVFLGLLVFMSAIAVVYYKHQSRLLFTKLQTLNQEIEALQVEWGQLLLEQGTWSSDARVERLAQEKLQMTLPLQSGVVSLEEEK